LAETPLEKETRNYGDVEKLIGKERLIGRATEEGREEGKSDQSQEQQHTSLQFFPL
jgi:hypothetical protein